MLNIKLNNTELDNTRLQPTQHDPQLSKALNTSTELLKNQSGKHDMNIYTYGGVALLPSVFFILGIMLIMSVIH